MSEAVAYKVLTTAEHGEWARSGVFAGSAADRADGFVHLSTATQLAGTLARHFAGLTDLVVAEIELAPLGDAVRWEAGRDGALFPHVYGTLPYTCVRAARPA